MILIWYTGQLVHIHLNWTYGFVLHKGVGYGKQNIQDYLLCEGPVWHTA